MNVDSGNPNFYPSSPTTSTTSIRSSSSFTDTVGIRWYGLAYVLAFVVAYLLLRRFSREGMFQVKPAELPDFVTLLALFGVLLGGRLGYFLLYHPSSLVEDPLAFFKIWTGGMASHGAIAGIALFLFVYARKKNYAWTNLGDHVVIVGSLGICLGRIANFINGELFGIRTTVPWAVKFPAEIHHSSYTPPSPDVALPPNIIDQLPGNSHEIYADAQQYDFLPQLEAALNPRHPSQLYQALLEGFLLFAILLAIRLAFRRLPNGLLTGIFFLGYAALRIVGEMYREPDSGIGRPFFGLSKGQFFSLFMVAAGIGFIIFALRKKRPSPASKAVSNT